MASHYKVGISVALPFRRKTSSSEQEVNGAGRVTMKKMAKVLMVLVLALVLCQSAMAAPTQGAAMAMANSNRPGLFEQFLGLFGAIWGDHGAIWGTDGAIWSNGGH